MRRESSLPWCNLLIIRSYAPKQGQLSAAARSGIYLYLGLLVTILLCSMSHPDIGFIKIGHD